MAEVSERELTGLYDSLSRFQWWRRRWSRPSPGAGLELHKRLNAPDSSKGGPAAGTAALHGWLLQWVSWPARPKVLDIGCGFGATIFSWARQRSGEFVGLSLSGYQLARANEQARQLGLADRCDFRTQSYDQPIDGHYDVVVSVESLFHAPEISHTMTNLRRSMTAGSTLMLLEDMATDSQVRQRPEARQLLQAWSTQSLHTREDYHRALAGASLEVMEEIDLTAQVPHGDPEPLTRSSERIERWKRWTPSRAGRRILDAFAGGMALEQLYAADTMRYVLIVARPSGSLNP